jgi:HSP20 family protein
MRHLLSSFVELVHLQSEMNKLFEALQTIQDSDRQPETGFTPPYDIFETPEAVLVEVDLPGVTPESLQVTVHGAFITIEGQRERNSCEGVVAYHLMERDRGAFVRRLRVEGAVNTHKGTATYRRGVLVLKFPRVENRRGAKVSIPVHVSP